MQALSLACPNCGAGLSGAVEVRGARTRSALEELSERRRQAAAAKRREGSYVLLGVGALFLLFAAACVVGVVIFAIDTRPMSPPICHPSGGFGGFHLALLDLPDHLDRRAAPADPPVAALH